MPISKFTQSRFSGSPFTFPTFNLATGSGGTADHLALITTVTASNNATIDVTGLNSSYFLYQFIWKRVVPSSDGVDFYMRTSTDGGSTFDTAGYAYAGFGIDAQTATHTPYGSSSSGEIVLNEPSNSPLGSATNEAGDFFIDLYNPSAADYVGITWRGVYEASSGRQTHGTGSAARETAADVDAVRFLFQTGNIESGTLKVYGYSAT